MNPFSERDGAGMHWGLDSERLGYQAAGGGDVMFGLCGSAILACSSTLKFYCCEFNPAGQPKRAKLRGQTAFIQL